MYKYLEPYAAMIEFLGKALGDNVEIALHDLTSKEQESLQLLITTTQEEKLGLNYQIYHYII